ncbi:MAG TPA: hypothetical protein DCP40_15510, partial [Stenotrophomonas sp.]|nr:hypothetical protein [Stenotrophomonas sp.]
MKLLLPLALAGLATLVLPAAAAEIRVVQPVPFSESAIIAEAIKTECTIGTTLAQSLASNASRHGNT